MFNLREFRKRPAKLFDMVQWAYMWEPGIVVNKDGSLQCTFSYRGHDLDSATQGELTNMTSRVNNSLKRLDEGWAVYIDAIRRKNTFYPTSEFPDAISFMIDEERRGLFRSGQHFESEYYCTLMWMPPSDSEQKIGNFFKKKEKTKTNKTLNDKDREILNGHINHFKNEVLRVFDMFSDSFLDAKILDADETLTYLHSTVSTKHHVVKTPTIPHYLDVMLCDSPLIAGEAPMLADKHLRVVSLRSFPAFTEPGLMDCINRLNIEYRWTTRYIPLSKEDAVKEGEKLMKQWFGKRKSFASLTTEIFTGRESLATDTNAIDKAGECQTFIELINGDFVNSGYFVSTITILDASEKEVDKKARLIEKTLNNLGFIAFVEKLNALEAWIGSIPCTPRYNVIRPLLTSITAAHLMPLSAIWAGEERNQHFDDHPLLYAPTTGSTKFRLNLHVDGVGHSMVIGPTGAGKSVLLSTIAAQFKRYKDSNVYIFDKGGSSRVLTYGVNGVYYDLAADDNDLAFQPLANIHIHSEKAWAEDWIIELLTGEGIEINPDIKDSIHTAMVSLANSPIEQRTLTGFKLLIQNPLLRNALTPFTQEGIYGKLFDANADSLKLGKWIVFEMGKLMEMKGAVTVALQYLFHRLDVKFEENDGEPSLLILDECWLFLDKPIFADKIREWLKVLRKLNVSVIFATQSLQDVNSSVIAPTIMDNCKTKIFLPNPNALESHAIEHYRSFGLNDTEINIIAMQMVPKRHYYYKSEKGSRVFELALKELAIAYIAASRTDEQKHALEIVKKHGQDEFNLHWLRYKGLNQPMERYNKLTKRVVA